MATTLAIHFDPAAIHAAVDRDGCLDLIVLVEAKAGTDVNTSRFR